MRTLDVSIERDGQQVPVGMIRGEESADASFSYDWAYLSDTEAVPVSLSLPLQEEAFSPLQTRNFFEGLLPEGFTRHSVASWMHVDEGDYLSILAGLGRECLGALCICESDAEGDISPRYEKLSIDQVKQLAREGTTKSVQLVTKAHLSLTGASGKVGLYYDQESREWYLPEGSAPSTHILKQSHVRLREIVVNEQLSLLAASYLGIRVPHSFIVNVGRNRDEDVLLATRRFDRIISKGPMMVDGLQVPSRLHQEDFAQAMGIASAHKYETNGEEYLMKMFRLIRNHSANPVQDQLALWDMVVFHFLAGNTDGHIKNFSLLYGKDLKSIRLAPAYDIISTAVYESSTRDMAFSVGGDISLDEITRDSFAREAARIGLGSRMALARLDRMAERFPDALQKAAAVLEEEGFEGAAALGSRIMQRGGIQQFKTRS